MPQNLYYVTVARLGKLIWLVTICCCVLLADGIHGDQGDSSGGFYRADDEDESNDCGATIRVNQVHGQLTSPQYPNNYPNELDCDWLLVAAPGEHVKISFEDIDIETEYNCQYDYVAVYDGPDATFDQIGVFCGSEEPVDIISTNRHLYIKFHSDNSDGGRGFYVDHVITMDGDVDGDDESIEEDEPGNHGCNRRLTDTEGIVESPNYPDRYPSDSDCVYVITADVGAIVSLTFLDFSTEGFGCSFDYVIVKDGDNEGADEIDTYCGNTIPDPVISTGTSLYIHFVSDGADNRKGFRIQYKQRAIGQQSHGMEFIDTPVNKTVEMAQSISQRCTVNQNDATITWLKDGVTLHSGETNGIYILDNGILVIPFISEGHLGKYSCVATNGNGDIIITNALLHLPVLNTIAPPPDVFAVVPVSTSLSEDQDQVFECETKPDSGMTVVWEKDGQQIANNPRLFITAIGLMIPRVLPSDGGTYTCVAVNDNGERVSEHSATLTVTAKKTAAEICGKVIVGTESDTGDSSEEDNFRIIDGKVSVRGSAPWMARLWHNYHRRHFCGGSVLNEYWVVTAAHCITEINAEPNSIQVRLGDHDNLRTEEGERLYDVAQIVVYPDFVSEDYDGDIALIKVTTKIEFMDYVIPICLPDVSLARNMLRRRQIGRVLGWGRTIEDGAYPRFLNEVNVPIRRTRECRESAKPHTITANMFCAGYKRALTGDACRGDSGGPFVEERNNTWYLVGIVSWGEGCARQDEFGFYTKVYRFYTWMDQVMGQ